MRNITRRRALVAIPAAAAVTALPALASVPDPDAELLSAIRHLDGCIAAHKLAVEASRKAYEQAQEISAIKSDPAWESACEKTGYTKLWKQMCDRGENCDVAAARVFSTPAQTARGVREKFRIFDDLMVGDEPDGVDWQTEDDEWCASIMRDLDRLVAS